MNPTSQPLERICPCHGATLTEAGRCPRGVRTAYVGTNRVDASRDLERVRDYLPTNFHAHLNRWDDRITIAGKDDHGWTLTGYVIPRLASGLIVAEEIC